MCGVVWCGGGCAVVVAVDVSVFEKTRPVVRGVVKGARKKTTTAGGSESAVGVAWRVYWCVAGGVVVVVVICLKK